MKKLFICIHSTDPAWNHLTLIFLSLSMQGFISIEIKKVLEKTGNITFRAKHMIHQNKSFLPDQLTPVYKVTVGWCQTIFNSSVMRVVNYLQNYGKNQVIGVVADMKKLNYMISSWLKIQKFNIFANNEHELILKQVRFYNIHKHHLFFIGCMRVFKSVVCNSQFTITFW